MPKYGIDHQTFLLITGMSQGEYLISTALWQGEHHATKKRLIRAARQAAQKREAEQRLTRQQQVRDVKAMQDFLDRHPVIETEAQNEEALKLVEPAFTSEDKQALFTAEEVTTIETLISRIVAFEDQNYPLLAFAE